jgi:hypothetical protein
MAKNRSLYFPCGIVEIFAMIDRLARADEFIGELGEHFFTRTLAEISRA